MAPAEYIALPTREPDSSPAIVASVTPRPHPRQNRWLWRALVALSVGCLLLAAHLRKEIQPLLSRRRSDGAALDLPPHEYFGNSRHFPPRIWGPGLTTARQNVAIKLYIDFDETAQSPLSVNESLSVWLEGPARVAVAVVYAGKGRFVGTYTPYDAGEYTLHADIYERGPYNTAYPYWQPLGRAEGYNVTVTRQDGSLARGSGRQELAFPRDRCTGEEDTTEGRWVRCEDTPLACVRYGWIWLPRTCYFHIYTAEELVEQDLWIAVAGTSVWRGIFFAGLDHLLGERAANLSAPTSRFWKCWGRLSVETQQLRLSYLDFREECTKIGKPDRCTGADYHEKLQTTLSRMGRDRDGRGPDLVLWEVNFLSGFNFSTLPLYRQMIGEAWDGTFLAVQRTESFEKAYEPEMTTKLVEEFKNAPEHRIETFNIARLGSTMFDTMEFPHSYQSSFHWHGQCNLAGMHSCSPVDDMIFQMVLNIATHRQLTSPRPSLVLAPPSPSLGSDMRFCLQCPPQLDFSMRPEVELECFDTLPSDV